MPARVIPEYSEGALSFSLFVFDETCDDIGEDVDVAAESDDEFVAVDDSETLEDAAAAVSPRVLVSAADREGD